MQKKFSIQKCQHGDLIPGKQIPIDQIMTTEPSNTFHLIIGSFV
jgi:hypothetical protein